MFHKQARTVAKSFMEGVIIWAFLPSDFRLLIPVKYKRPKEVQKIWKIQPFHNKNAALFIHLTKCKFVSGS